MLTDAMTFTWPKQTHSWLVNRTQFHYADTAKRMDQLKSLFAMLVV